MPNRPSERISGIWERRVFNAVRDNPSCTEDELCRKGYSRPLVKKALAKIERLGLMPPMVECQASIHDGECVHYRCPVDWKSIKTGADPSIHCPLPWLRLRRAIDDEL